MCSLPSVPLAQMKLKHFRGSPGAVFSPQRFRFFKNTMVSQREQCDLLGRASPCLLEEVLLFGPLLPVWLLLPLAVTVSLLRLYLCVIAVLLSAVVNCLGLRYLVSRRFYLPRAELMPGGVFCPLVPAQLIGGGEASLGMGTNPKIPAQGGPEPRKITQTEPASSDPPFSRPL
ncbi:UNVERIFIED_CONTAM: hypothetical protein K2H54_071930 [Gekko kuhli]